jgi:hypothetical protein
LTIQANSGIKVANGRPVPLPPEEVGTGAP